jgi:hypothetical protein
MQFLAILKVKPDAPREKLGPLMKPEAAHVWEMTTSGVIRRGGTTLSQEMAKGVVRVCGGHDLRRDALAGASGWYSLAPKLLFGSAACEAPVSRNSATRAIDWLSRAFANRFGRPVRGSRFAP